MELSMLADPQSVTLTAGAVSLPRVTNIDANTTQFTSADGALTMSVRQTVSKDRFRREIRLAPNKIAADPISAVNKAVSASIYLVIDEPRYGFSDAELLDHVTGLVTWLSASTYANTTKVIGGQQ
jgi:hypothetical protein